MDHIRALATEFQELCGADLKTVARNSLVVQWLGRHTFTAQGAGSIPGRGTKILPAAWHGKKTPQKQTQLPSRQELILARLVRTEKRR